MVGQYDRKFMTCRQQDSHEFLMALLNTLEDGFDDEFNHLKTGSNVPNVKGIHLDNIIKHFFDSKIVSSVKCHECGYVSKTKENHRCLILETFPTLNESINHFTRDELLDGKNRWSCEKCKKLVKSTKTLTIEQLSETLIIQLKRFQFSKSSSKITSKVDIPFLMEVNGKKYQLTGAIKHMGNVGGGHYISVGKHKDIWYLLNDSSVSVINDDQVKKIMDESYVLFYTIVN